MTTRISRKLCAYLFIPAFALSHAVCQDASAREDPGTVLRFDVNLVQLDAVVTDGKNRHIATLTPEDFEVLQDGKLQKLTNFEYVPGNGGAGSEDTRQAAVIVFDDRKMSFSDFVYSKRALYRLLGTSQSGLSLAVTRTSGGSGTMQQFSSDPAYFREVLDRMAWSPPSPYELKANVFAWVIEAIRALAGYPGRKSVIWISPGLRYPAGESVMDYIRRVADEANRASVTIQTIDVRGLPAQLLDRSVPDASRAGPPDLSYHPWPSVDPPDAGYFRSQAVLAEPAEMTGGLFQHDDNDLFAQLRKAISDGDGYYLLGWYPGPDAFTHRANEPIPYHRVRIKVRKSGLIVRSRSGYYATPGESQVSGQHFGPEAQMEDALFSPLRKREINLQIASVLDNTERLEPYIRSWVQIGPEGIRLQPADAPDCSVISLEFASAPLLLSWSDYGNVRIQWIRTSLRVCGSALEEVLKRGLVADVRTPVQAPGAYQMRVAVRNLSGNESAGSLSLGQLTRRESMDRVNVQTGSADEVIEIPDWRKEKEIVSGLFVGTTAPQIPEQSVEDASIGVRAEGDFAVRKFHPGETVTYGFRLIAATPNENVRMHLTRDGADVYTSVLLKCNPNQRFIGTYLLSKTSKPGHYVLEIEGKGPRRHDELAWAGIPFEIVH